MVQGLKSVPVVSVFCTAQASAPPHSSAILSVQVIFVLVHEQSETGRLISEDKLEEVLEEVELLEELEPWAKTSQEDSILSKKANKVSMLVCILIS